MQETQRKSDHCNHRGNGWFWLVICLALLGLILTAGWASQPDAVALAQDAVPRALSATPPPRMRVSKTVIAPADGEIAIGENVTFRITVRNVGVIPIGFLWVRDQFPVDNLVYVSASPDGFEDASGYISWTGVPLPQGRLQPSESVSLEVTFRAIAAYPNMVNYALASGWTIDNQPVPPAHDGAPIKIVARNLYCVRSWPDYAPVGVPDFDQRQDGWRHSESGKWTYDAPVAAANLLWWLDSGREEGNTPPPTPSDSYPLVSAYGDWDDHDPRNVQPLVEDLAQRMDTDEKGAGGGDALGTAPTAVRDALIAYIADQGLDAQYSVALVASPSVDWLNEAVRRCDGVVLLLGFWEDRGEVWKRLGGHYVTVPCVARRGEDEPLIELSDPYWDRTEAGWPGQYHPGLPHRHPANPPDTIHNDTRYISWDLYDIGRALAPVGNWRPEGYPTSAEDVDNFVGLNVPAEFVADQVPRYRGGEIAITVEYALRIRDLSDPPLCPRPPITPSPTPTATPILEERSTVLQQGLEGYTGIRDTYISEWAPHANYGQASLLQVRSDGPMLPLIRFDLSDLPQGTVIRNATLTLYALYGGWYEQDLGLYPVLIEWDAEGATWYLAREGVRWHEPGCQGEGTDRTVYPRDVTLAVTGAYSVFEIADVVQAWVDNPEDNHGVVIEGRGDIAVQHSLVASEHWNGKYRPKLTIEYGVPVKDS